MSFLPNPNRLAGLALAALLSLSACGGGGGGNDAPSVAPPAAVKPPGQSTPLHVTVLAGAQYDDIGPGQFVDGAAATARFYRVSGLAMDKAGNVFVADAGNCAIRKITPAGTVSTLAGGQRCAAPDSDMHHVDGAGGAAVFYQLGRIVIDSSDNLYAIDGAAIRKITPQGVVSTFAGQLAGSEPIADGAGAAARFYRIEELAIAPDGGLLVRDATLRPAVEGHYMSCVETRDYDFLRQVSPLGVVTTLADTGFNCLKANPSLLTGLRNIRITSKGTLYGRHIGDVIQRPAGGTPAVVLDANGNKLGSGYYLTPRDLTLDDAGNYYWLNYSTIDKIGADRTPVPVLQPYDPAKTATYTSIPLDDAGLLTYVGNHDFLLSVKNQILRVTLP
jgi:hypothetical protein